MPWDEDPAIRHSLYRPDEPEDGPMLPLAVRLTMIVLLSFGLWAIVYAIWSWAGDWLATLVDRVLP